MLLGFNFLVVFFLVFVVEIKLQLLTALGASDDTGGLQLPHGATTLVAASLRNFSLRNGHVDTSLQ